MTALILFLTFVLPLTALLFSCYHVWGEVRKLRGANQP